MQKKGWLFMNKTLKCLSITASSAIIAQLITALPVMPEKCVLNNNTLNAYADGTLTEDEVLYKDVLDEYVNNVIPTGSSPNHPDWFFGGWVNTSGNLDDFQYTFYDINGDNTNELVMGKDDEFGTVLEFFTLYDGEVKPLIIGEDICAYYFNSDENIVRVSRPGDSNILFHIENGSLVPFKHYMNYEEKCYIAEGENCDEKTWADMTLATEDDVAYLKKIVDGNIDVFADGATNFADYSARSSEVPTTPETKVLTAEELTAMFNAFYAENLEGHSGSVLDYFEVHDYDGNGTLEGFSISQFTQGMADRSIIHFINSDGQITEVENIDYSQPNTDAPLLYPPAENTEFKFYTANGHGFLTYTTAWLGINGDFYQTALLGVRNNTPYILNTAGMNGFYQKEDGTLYTLVQAGTDADGNAVYEEHYLVYNEETGEFSIGDRIVVDTTNYQCGANAFWSFDEATGKLTVSGTGAMYDYNDAHPFFTYDPETDPPYAEIADKITTIEIGEGITGVGNKAFHGSYVNLQEIILPEGLQVIGDDAFNIMFFDEVPSRAYELPDGVLLIGDRAFYALTNVAIESEGVFIPRSVKLIGDNAFGYFGYVVSADDEEPEIIKMEGFKIQGYENSAAQSYAEKNGFEFEEWVDLDEDGNQIVYEDKSNGSGTGSKGSSSGSTSGASGVQSSPKTGVTAPVGALAVGAIAVAGLAVTKKKKEN